jgi:hypothetical protein
LDPAGLASEEKPAGADQRASYCQSIHKQCRRPGSGSYRHCPGRDPVISNLDWIAHVDETTALGLII